MKNTIKNIDEQIYDILREIAHKYFPKKDKSDIPVNTLLRAYGESLTFHYDIWADEYAYRAVGAPNKRWLANITPSEILLEPLKFAIDIIMTLSEGGVFFKHFPPVILTPDYGDNWGRCANYIEINNRAIAKMTDNKCSSGIISSIKLLSAIPPSAKSWANCVILSQIFPNIYGDGYNKPVWEENSIYGIKLNAGYSKNIIDFSVVDKASPEMQFRAFNDLAHFRGLKTGFRTVISEDQIKVAYSDMTDSCDENFRWHNPEHVELFIKEHVKLVKLGFEAIFIDSAKHVGGFDCDNYTGVGRLPEYHQMQYILHEIRHRSGCPSISFVGEKSSVDFDRYRNMGLTAGTALIDPDHIEAVKEWSNKFKYWRDYAPGVEVSNDNDEGGRSYEARLNRINSCLFGFEYASDKLPSFMQMEDLFPLRYDTSTHHLMMCNPSYSIDGTTESHWEELFASEDGRWYNHLVGEKFAHALGL